jgi:hypothetical protein
MDGFDDRVRPGRQEREQVVRRLELLGLAYGLQRAQDASGKGEWAAYRARTSRETDSGAKRAARGGEASN